VNDLDDLLDEFGDAGKGHAQVHEYKYEIPINNSGASTGGGKCSTVFMGGSSLEPGQTLSSLNAKACDRLRCLDCDKKVHRFPDQQWKATVDYLFVRNY